MSREREEKGLSTADLVSASAGMVHHDAPAANESAREPELMEAERAEGAYDDERVRERDESMQPRDMPPREMPPREMQPRQDAGIKDGITAQSEPLAALFDADLSQDFRMHWSNVQIGFVDDPKRAVQQADELVAQVMKSLAESFARQRAEIEAGMGSGESASTENMRVALRRYRSFFERLLSL